jgi:hypothetical protein
MPDYGTVFGSIDNFQKGGVQIIDDDPKNYVFSNMFEVASRSRPYERVAVGKNFEYVIECARAEGASPCTLMIQSIQGPETIERWADICQTK